MAVFLRDAKWQVDEWVVITHVPPNAAMHYRVGDVFHISYRGTIPGLDTPAHHWVKFDDERDKGQGFAPGVYPAEWTEICNPPDQT